MKATIKAAGLLLSAVCASLLPQAHAQQYPTKPMRLVIPWPPGGITAVVSRSLAAVLSDSMGQQMVPDNRPGAAGTVGVGIVAKSDPDGYTLLMSDVPSHAISASLYTRLPYDPVKDTDLVAIDAGLVLSGPGLPKRCNELLLRQRISSPDCASERIGLEAARSSWFWAFWLGLAMLIGGLLASALGFWPGLGSFLPLDPRCRGTNNLIREGAVFLEDLGHTLTAGDMFGEIGLLSEHNRRMATAVCVGRTHLLSITRDQVTQLFFQNPEFGFFLMRLVTGRLMKNSEASNESPGVSVNSMRPS